MGNSHDDDKHQQFIDTLIHTTRALSGDETVDIVFKGGGDQNNSSLGNKHIQLPPLPAHCTPSQQNVFKALADRQAFLHRYGWLENLQHALNLEPKAFADFIYPIEQARTETQGRQMFAGCIHHLDHLARKEAEMINQNDATLNVGYVLALALRQALGQKLARHHTKHLKKGAHFLTPGLKNWLKHAQKHLNNPSEQEHVYQDLIQILGLQAYVRPEGANSERSDEEHGTKPDDVAEHEEKQGTQWHTTTSHHQGLGHQPPQYTKEGTHPDPTQAEDTEEATGLQKNFRTFDGDGTHPYRPFTTDHDLVQKADKLVTPEEQSRLRDYYKRVTMGAQKTAMQMSVKLQRFLMAQAQLDWKVEQEEGVLDPKKLTQIITSVEPFIYRMPTVRQERDTIVTLLLDNSGSMRGKPIEMVAVSADVLIRTLERCGVRTEVLGFTTQAWKGGQSRLDWIAEGSPENPGRLNDVLHVIYKDANTPYRAAKPAFATMLADDLLKENIDGEGLLWAYERLLDRPEQRKILVVISDGAPVDYATDKHNNTNYLDSHLRFAVGQIQKQNKVELLAIGIGHDVSRYYQHAVTIQNSNQLGKALVERMVHLFSTHDRTPKQVLQNQHIELR